MLVAAARTLPRTLTTVSPWRRVTADRTRLRSHAPGLARPRRLSTDSDRPRFGIRSLPDVIGRRPNRGRAVGDDRPSVGRRRTRGGAGGHRSASSTAPGSASRMPASGDDGEGVGRSARIRQGRPGSDCRGIGSDDVGDQQGDGRRPVAASRPPFLRAERCRRTSVHVFDRQARREEGAVSRCHSAQRETLQQGLRRGPRLRPKPGPAASRRPRPPRP